MEGSLEGGFAIVSVGRVPSPDLEASVGLLLPPSSQRNYHFFFFFFFFFLLLIVNGVE